MMREMIDDGATASVQPRVGNGSAATAALVFVLVTAVTGGLAATPHAMAAQAITDAGAELTRLLRGMALLKCLMALAATAAVLWRMGSPIRANWFVAYAAAVATMAAGPGLIWQMAFVRTGALLLHGGLAMALVLLWRDPAVAERLKLLLIARRQRIRG